MGSDKIRKSVKNFMFEKYNASNEHASRAVCFRTKEAKLEEIILFFNCETNMFTENKFYAIEKSKLCIKIEFWLF
jgi:hypothetical protein